MESVENADDNLKFMKMQIVSRCYCCDKYHQETMEHLFIHAPIAQKLWGYFANIAILKVEGIYLHQMITQWWEVREPTKIRVIYRMVPTVLLWEIWKRKNSKRHNKDVKIMQLINQCENTINEYNKCLYPWIQCPNR